MKLKIYTVYIQQKVEWGPYMYTVHCIGVHLRESITKEKANFSFSKVSASGYRNFEMQSLTGR